MPRWDPYMGLHSQHTHLYVYTFPYGQYMYVCMYACMYVQCMYTYVCLYVGLFMYKGLCMYVSALFIAHAKDPSEYVAILRYLLIHIIIKIVVPFMCASTKGLVNPAMGTPLPWERRPTQ